MSRFPLLTALAVALLAACGMASAAKPGKLARVFDPDMLNATLAYFEHVTGPAWKIVEGRRTYKVDGCQVTITIDDDENVRSLRMALGPRCTFNLGKFWDTKLPPPHTLTFGKFDSSIAFGYGVFRADCLGVASCGNDRNPAVYEYRQGFHADGWLEIMVEADLASDAAIKASIAWEDAMVEGEGQDWVDEGKFNCPNKYDHAAHAAFKNVRITAMTIGFDLTSPAPWEYSHLSTKKPPECPS